MSVFDASRYRVIHQNSAYYWMVGEVVGITAGQERPGVQLEFRGSPDGRLPRVGWFDLAEVEEQSTGGEG